MKESIADKILESVHDGYNTIAAEFGATRDRIWWPEIEPFIRRIRNGDRVLDLGCGSGRALRLFVDLAVDYEGLDVSEGLIARARKEYPDPLVNFRVGSMLTLPYEDGSFDAVLAIASLHHIPSVRYRLQAMGEIRRVLKPGGWLLMTNWDLWRIDRRLRFVARNIILKAIGRSDLDWTDVMMPWTRSGQVRANRFYHAFTLGELSRLCRQTGFDVVENRRSGERRRQGDGNLVTVGRKPVI
ncbi:methyltransferase domain-containing protein [Candidatus Uhrbacteria bacterium]|nr:methyltransferase domain-containing protein [Candidatus Uhrbacteria bacterium]